MKAETSLSIRKLDSGGYTINLDGDIWECSDQKEMLDMLSRITAEGEMHGGQK